jgi:membrane-bound serine protease (ClpP class)
MRSILFALTCILFFFFSISIGEEIDKEKKRQVVILIPVSGVVDPAMAAFIGRAIRDNSDHEKPLFIIEMDTFGGRVDAALNIVDTLLTIPKGQSLAYVKKRAISAGALIALACSKLFMKNNTTIGDCAPLMMGKEGPQMLGEKYQSPLRAKFRALAKRNNYPAALSEAMVTAEMTVYKLVLPDTVLYVDSMDYADLSASTKRKIKSKKTIVKRGELLTMEDQEARELSFSSGSVENVEDILKELGIEEFEIINVEENWSEKFVGIIGLIAPLLMIIGLAGVYIETKTPGVGVPGIVGILCLALVFGGQYMVGMANYTEMLIITLGIVLLAAEVFIIPGFGITGIAGIFFIAIGMFLSLQDFVLPNPELPWQRDIFQKNLLSVLVSLFGSVILIVVFFMYLFPRLSKVVSGPYLSATLADAHTTPDNTYPIAIGDKGVVVKMLRPSGIVKIGANTYDVVTDGELINKDESIVVSEIKGNRIVVLRSKNDDN